MNLFLDHALVFVHNLPQAVKDYRSMGFTVRRGAVDDKGVARTAIIPFEDGTQIILASKTGLALTLGANAATHFTDAPEGLIGYAIRTQDIDADAERIRSGGLAVGEIVTIEWRNSHNELIQCRLLQIEDHYAPFFIQDVTPRDRRVPTDDKSNTHKNHAVRLAEVTLAVRSYDETKARHGIILDLTKEQIRLRYDRGFDLKVGSIRLTQVFMDLVQMDLKTLQQDSTLGIESVQNVVEFYQSVNELHTELYNSLSQNRIPEAPYSLTITAERNENALLTGEKVHGVRIELHTGVSTLNSLPVFDRIDAIDWSQVNHAYGSATDVPNTLRALLSKKRQVRDNAYEDLFSSIVHQGTVYPATLTALPFLIELLNVPDLRDKDYLLSLISACSGDGWDTDVIDEQQSLSQQRYRELRHSLWQIFLTGTPVYLPLLDDPAPKIRGAAAWTLSPITDDQSVQSALLSTLESEPDPGERRSIMESIVYGWLGHAYAKPAHHLTSEQAALLTTWMTSPTEPLQVRFRAGAFLFEHYLPTETKQYLDLFRHLFEQVVANLPDSKSDHPIFHTLKQALEHHYPAELAQWTQDASQHPT